MQKPGKDLIEIDRFNLSVRFQSAEGVWLTNNYYFPEEYIQKYAKQCAGEFAKKFSEGYRKKYMSPD